MVAASPAKQPLDYLPYAIGGFGGTFLLSWCLSQFLNPVLSAFELRISQALEETRPHDTRASI